MGLTARSNGGFQKKGCSDIVRNFTWSGNSVKVFLGGNSFSVYKPFITTTF